MPCLVQQYGGLQLPSAFLPTGCVLQGASLDLEPLLALPLNGKKTCGPFDWASAGHYELQQGNKTSANATYATEDVVICKGQSSKQAMPRLG